MKYWQTLSVRDRRALIIVGVVLLGFLFYSGVFQPLEDERQRLENRLRSAEKTLAWMQQAAVEVKALGNTPQQSGGGIGDRSLLAVVDETARAAKLSRALKRVEPQQGGDVRVWLEKAVFDDAVRWLRELEGLGIQVRQLSLTAEDTAGVGTLRLTVTTGGETP